MMSAKSLLKYFLIQGYSISCADTKVFINCSVSMSWAKIKDDRNFFFRAGDVLVLLDLTSLKLNDVGI